MKKAFIVIFTIIYVGLQSLSAFPGDHNSLTCDANFKEIPLIPAIVDSKNTPHSKIDDTILTEFYRQNTTALTVAELTKRNQVIAAIQADLAKPYPASIAKTNMRSRIISNDNGRVIHVTKWGDSLSDFVQLYGRMGPAYPGYETYKNQGIWGGGIGPIDSWDDYFSVFGNPANQNVVFVQNYGVATYTTDQVLGLMGVNLENSLDVNWWDSKITDDHCISEANVGYFLGLGYPHVFSGKSALRSSVMIGGNDVFHDITRLIPIFPIFGGNLVSHIVDNITMITDWHIENGKKILLEGNLPGLTGKIRSYNSVVVSRQALCRPFDETFVPPQKIPWWLCAIGPAVCAKMKQATIDYYKTIEREFRIFGTNIIEQDPDKSNTQNTQGFLDNPIGYTTTFLDNTSDTIDNQVMNQISPMPADGGESKQNNPWMRAVSINLACINDRIEQDIGPSYKESFPNNVDYLPLYNQFNITGNDLFAPFFWVPKPGLYRKYMGRLAARTQDLGILGLPDVIHVGPAGYQLWGSIEGAWLKQKEWNRIPIETDYPDPVIELDNDGPGKKIKRKAMAINWYGKETSTTKQILKRITGVRDGAGTYGGYYRKYPNGIIFLQQINDLSTSANGSKFGEPFSVSGLLLDRYIQEGGPAGNLGFPTTDPYMVHFNSIDRAGFQCGYIDHNQMNILDPTNTSVTITSVSCVSNNSKLY